MLLYNDKEKFAQLVTDVSNELGIRSSLVEKDYFVTLFLKQLTEKEPLLVFKGGTSLSKCFKLIKRFSEDLDINLDGVSDLTQGRKKKLKENILSVIASLNLKLANPEQIRSGMDYNLYKVEYDAMFADTSLKQHLEIESVFRIGSFPTVKMPVTSFIYDFLKKHGADSSIKEFELEPFNIRVQSLERTFIDKIFAICDYYLSERVESHSRHLYDIHKILPHIKLNGELKILMEEVRVVREGKADCLSADKSISILKILNSIIIEKTYKNDYNSITALLLYEDITYDETIESLKTITNWLAK